MPIRGLTDREEGAFPQIGVIRKGAPKQQNAPGKDLPYFRVEFDDKEIEAAQDFVSRFTNAPTDITIMLPFNEIDRCWEAWRETYVAGAMIHRCDGEYVRYAINAKTGEKLVLNGLSLADGRPVACKGKPDGCKPVGRLRVIIPELQRLAYLVVITTSIHDIINISNQLKAIAQMTNGRIAGIPLVLRRRPKKISTPSGENGKRARREKWLISIEADPEWVRAQLAKMHHDALPGNGLGDAKQISAPVYQLQSNGGPEWTGDFDDEDEGEESETVEGEVATTQEQPAAPPVETDNKLSEYLAVVAPNGHALNEYKSKSKLRELRQWIAANADRAAQYEVVDIAAKYIIDNTTLIE